MWVNLALFCRFPCMRPRRKFTLSQLSIWLRRGFSSFCWRRCFSCCCCWHIFAEGHVRPLIILPSDISDGLELRMGLWMYLFVFQKELVSRLHVSMFALLTPDFPPRMVCVCVFSLPCSSGPQPYCDTKPIWSGSVLFLSLFFVEDKYTTPYYYTSYYWHHITSRGQHKARANLA